MKHLLLFFLLSLFTTVLVAQNDDDQDDTTAEEDTLAEEDISPWTYKGSLGLNFNRVNLNNWAGGGRNSVAVGSIFKGRVNIVKDKWAWRNSLDMAYGTARVGGSDNIFKKSDDQIILVSKYSKQLDRKLNFSGLLDFRTQIAFGFNYTEVENDQGEMIERAQLISKFMNPGFLLTSLGLEYREENYFFIGAPVTGKFTFVTDDEFSDRGDFGINPGDHIRPELGTMIKAGFDDDIWKNVTLSTNVTLFSNYERYGNIDVNWEMQLSFKINEYLQANFTTYLIYDEDIDIEQDDGSTGPAVQFKDVFNVGFLYTL